MNGNSSRTVQPDAQPEIAPGRRIRTGNMEDVVEPGFIRLSPRRTHDITDTEHHVPNIQHVAADINDAIQAAWPKRDKIRYSCVLVLLSSWEDDDLGVHTEIDTLQKVFQDMYHFSVTRFKIPSLKPVIEVHKCIMKFLENDAKDILRIVYYGGHGRGVQYSTEPPIWFANRYDPSAQFPSGGIQSLLEAADSDVLLLYDCCHSATVPTCSSHQGGVTEVIAACGYEATAPEVDKHSFTKALIDILIITSKEVPFSVGWLHSRILSNLKCWSPGVKALPNGEYVYERQPRRTPIYSLLSETRPRRSIVLGPLPSPACLPSTNGQGYRKPMLINSTSSTPLMSGTGGPSKKRKECSEEVKYPQILIAIRVDETPLNKEEWVEWMRNVPVNGRDIHVEGRWDSFSTLLLLRIPVEVWNLFPEHPAYSFVGFVTSENLALAQAPSNSNKTCNEDSRSKPIPESETADHLRQEQSGVPTGGLSARPLIPGDGESSSHINRPNVFDPMRRINIHDNVRRLTQGWNSTETITFREKILFICGVFNILLSGYIIGGYPQYFHYWYTAQLLYLLPIRYYTFHKRGFHFFLADLCYVVNILCMCTIWLFPRSTRLFIGTYCLAFGNNAISITMWRSLMVFHSLDKVTTVFIHVMPCVALHCLVHLLPPDLQQERFPAIWAIKMLAPSLNVQDSLMAMTVWSTVPYFLWQLSYYFMITVRQREQIAAGNPTSFTWLRKRYAQAAIGKVMLSLPESLQEPAFMMLQYIYIILTSLPCLIWFWNRYASTAFLVVVFSGSVYNGATYYIEVFDKRYKTEEEFGR